MFAICTPHLPSIAGDRGIGNDITRVTGRTDQKHVCSINISRALLASPLQKIAVERTAEAAFCLLPRLCRE